MFVKRNVSKLKNNFRRNNNLTLYFLIAPAFLSLLVWYYYPVAKSFIMSLYSWDGFLSARFIGLSNYKEALTDPDFWMAMRNMLIILIFKLTIPFIIPFLVAELIMSIKSKWARDLYRTVLIIPMVVPVVVWALMWRNIYDYSNGFLNVFLKYIGLEVLVRNWLNDPVTALGAILFISFPFVSSIALLIFSAGIEAIPTSIYDAVKIDGANVFKRLTHIDIPFCIPQFRFLAITSFAGIIADYTAVLLLTQGRPMNRTLVPGYYIYRYSTTDMRYGYSSAVALMLIILILIITFLFQKYMKSETEYYAK